MKVFQAPGGKDAVSTRCHFSLSQLVDETDTQLKQVFPKSDKLIFKFNGRKHITLGAKYGEWGQAGYVLFTRYQDIL